MKEILLLALATTTAMVVVADDGWDYFSNPNWWHSLSLWSTNIKRADCLLYLGKRNNDNFRIPEKTTVSGIPLSRHHIIPGSVLLRFFNVALEENGNNNRQFAGLLEILGNLANTFLEYYEDNTAIDEEIRDQLSLIRRIQLEYLTGDQVPLYGLFDASDLARAIFYWMPINIFMGPRHRSDDPGNQFETNANYIIENDDSYQLFVRIEYSMRRYASFRSERYFNHVIVLLQRLISRGRQGRDGPYPYRAYQWRTTGVDNNGNQLYAIDTSRDLTVTTTTQAPRMYYMKREIRREDFYYSDPLCLRPMTTYDLELKHKNLVIAASEVGRVEVGVGFEKKYNYRTWVDWLYSFYWKDGWTSRGIANYGRMMWSGRYGILFNDNSFVVGVAGADLKFGNDSWTNGVWDVNTLGGLMFFDKNSRPVALAVSDKVNSDINKGWLFVYFNCGWKQLSRSLTIQEALSTEFPGNSYESLDSEALTFVPSNIKKSYRDEHK